MRFIITFMLVLLMLAVSGNSGLAQKETEYPKYMGIWKTDLGVVALWQGEDAVWGAFDSRGELGGYIEDSGLLRFNWQNLPDDRGTGWFDLSDDGKSFKGMWYSSIDANKHGNWNGEWLDENNYKFQDREALKHVPGETSPDADESVEDIPPTENADTNPIIQTPDESLAELEVTPPPITSDPTSAWSGKWTSNRGDIVLNVSENSVSGTFGESGVIEGTLDGSVINGSWKILDENGEISAEGELIFWLNEADNSFRGSYNKSSAPDTWLAWAGSR